MFLKIVFLLLFTILTVQNAFAVSNIKEYRVKRIKVTGNEHFSSSYIRSLMEIKSKGFLNRLMPWKKDPVFSKGLLEGDIRRITRYYRHDGFLDVMIQDPQIKYDDNKNRVAVTIIIQEGERVKVNSIVYKISNEIDNHRNHLNEIISKSVIQENSYFNDADFLSDLTMIADYYDKNGFPSVSTDYILTLDEPGKLVDIEITVKPGYKSYFGSISFTGAERTDINLLNKLLTIEEGNQYSPANVLHSRARLQSLGLFRLVSINLQVDKETDRVPVDIYLHETPSYNLSFGFGYGIEDKFRTYTELTKMRFMGGLRKGNIYLKHSALEPVHVSFTFFQPAFPLIDSNLNLNPFYRLEDEPAYSLERVGANLIISHRISERTQTYLSYSFESNDLKEGTDDVFISEFNPFFERSKYYKKSSISWGLIRDSSNPDFYPSAGTLFSNIITVSGYGFKSDYRFWRWLTEGRYYNQINSLFIVALKVKTGMIKSFEFDNFVPYEERFYSGGAYSVRGWSRAMLGPENSEGDPVGGKSVFESSIELRYPVWNKLSGVFFLDSGNVWEDTLKYNFNALHYAAGIGVRYATPVGAGRLDFALPVFEGKSSLQFFISLGQAF